MDKKFRYGVKTTDQIWMSGDMLHWVEYDTHIQINKVDGTMMMLPLCNVIYFTAKEVKDGEGNE